MTLLGAISRDILSLRSNTVSTSFSPLPPLTGPADPRVLTRDDAENSKPGSLMRITPTTGKGMSGERSATILAASLVTTVAS